MSVKSEFRIGVLCGVIAGGVVLSTTAQAGVVVHTDSIIDFDGPTFNSGAGVVTTSGASAITSETYNFTYVHPEYTLTFDLLVGQGGPTNPLVVDANGHLTTTGGEFFSFELDASSISIVDNPGGFPNPTLNSYTLTDITFVDANDPVDSGYIAIPVPPGFQIWDELGGGAILPGETTNRVALDILGGVPANNLLSVGMGATHIYATEIGVDAGVSLQVASIGFQIAVNIPEPSRAVLLLLGGCGIALRRRRGQVCS